MVEKIVELLPFLEKQGPVYLFAFAEREDVPRWDVVLSSKWSDNDMPIAVFKVAKELTARLEPQEVTLLSRIAVVPSSDPNILEFFANFDEVKPQDKRVIYGSLLGSDVRRAFIFKAQRPPALSAAKNVVGASFYP